MNESCLCVLFRIATKRKHNEGTLKTKYEELKELDKNRPNKEVAIQFNVSRSTLSTWYQPSSIIFCCIDCFWIFWASCRGNYRSGWWKWRYRLRWTNCASLKKWRWRGNQNFEHINSVHTEFRFWSFNLKANLHNQSVKKR